MAWLDPSRPFRLGVVVFALALASLSILGVRAALSEIHADFRPVLTRPALPVEGALAASRSVVFHDAAGDEIHGWWLPSKNGAAVIFLHGTGADRAQLVPQAEVVARLGYGVLLYDSPGHGESI